MSPDPLLAAAISRITKEINNRMFEIKEQLDAVAKSYNLLERDIESLDSYCKQYMNKGIRDTKSPSNHRCDSCGEFPSHRFYNHAYLCKHCLYLDKRGVARHKKDADYNEVDTTFKRIKSDKNYGKLQRTRASVGSLITEKQKAYGDSFHKSGKVLEQLFPNGIPNHCYVDALAIVRIVDKLFRIATDPDWGGESPWRDVAGYALLRLADREAKIQPDDIMDRIYPDRMPAHSWDVTYQNGNWSIKDRGEDDGS